MALVLVSSSQLKQTLDELCEMFASSVGPNGCLCLSMSSVNALTLTSSSSRIIPNIPFNHPILQFIQQCIGSQNKKYTNGGFYCGIILTKLLSRILESSLPQPLACCILNEFASIMQDGILNSALRIDVNLDSVHPFLSVAQSILLSKCGLHKQENSSTLNHSQEQASLLVQAFLQSEASLGKVFLNVAENSDKQFLYKGILYKCTEEEYVVLDGQVWSNVSILLFSVMLTDQIDCKDSDLTKNIFPSKGKIQFELSQQFIEKAISLGVNVIACQKVVHPKFLLKLRRKGILVVQRLGKHMTEALEKTSGAILISSLETSLFECMDKLKGSLSRVQHIEEEKNNCVLLEGSDNRNVCSLQLSTRSLEGGPNLKVIAHQVLVALSHVLQDAAVCPGAGCSEVFLCILLWKKIQTERETLCKKLSCSSVQLISVMVWLQEGLLKAAGLNFGSGKLAVDSIFHHAWKGSDSNIAVVNTSSCNCGLVKSHEVERFKGSWSFVSSDHMRQWICKSEVNAFSLPSTLIGNNSVVDVCTIKRSAIGLAVDSCIAMANIGAIIVKKT